MRRIVIAALAALMAVATAAPSFAVDAPTDGPITPNLIYAGGELRGTILLGELPYNGNDHSFDKLFLLDGQNPVAEAAPGQGYNGGRWLPTPVEKTASFPDGLIITSYEELAAAAYDGFVVIGEPDTANAFLCPLLKNH